MSTAGPLTGKRALVVEDEALVALLIEEMLADLGFTDVRHVASARDVPAIVEAAPPDVAILDLNLGGHKTLDLAEKLRDRGIPFVFATGYARDGLPAEWKAQPIVNKPFSCEMLGAAIKAALAQHGA